MISNIAHKINERIAAKTAAYPCLSGMRFFGLAEPVLRSESEEEVFPVIVDDKGECTAIAADDDFPAGIYHRLLSKTYSFAPMKSQFGNEKVQQAEAELLLICWAFREATGTTADIIESLIYASFDTTINAIQSNFDRRAVFGGEFSGIPFFLPEEVMLFSMKYRFKYPAQAKECLNIENFCN